MAQQMVSKILAQESLATKITEEAHTQASNMIAAAKQEIAAEQEKRLAAFKQQEKERIQKTQEENASVLADAQRQAEQEMELLRASAEKNRPEAVRLIAELLQQP